MTVQRASQALARSQIVLRDFERLSQALTPKGCQVMLGVHDTIVVIVPDQVPSLKETVQKALESGVLYPSLYEVSTGS